MNHPATACLPLALFASLLLPLGCSNVDEDLEADGNAGAGGTNARIRSGHDSSAEGGLQLDDPDASGADAGIGEWECPALDPLLPKTYDECLEAGGRTDLGPEACSLIWPEGSDDALYQACRRSDGYLGHEDHPDGPKYYCTMHYPPEKCPCGLGNCPLPQRCGLSEPCPDGYWCDYADDLCGLGDLDGYCYQESISSPYTSPVCTCHGTVAGIATEAHAGRVDVSLAGGCPVPEGYMECNGALCRFADKYCLIHEGSQGNCLFLDWEDCRECRCAVVPDDCTCDVDPNAGVTVRCPAR